MNQTAITLSTQIWLRSETKPAEKRTALTPNNAVKLVDAGFRLTVEQSSQSVFGWEEFETSGCDFADEHSWNIKAPDDAIILGLKELESIEFPLRHRHIHFAHVYKNQLGWRNVLSRFKNGGGTLYDLEFLIDDNGKRIAAFGHWAGFCGAALAVQAWCNRKIGDSPVLAPVTFRPNQSVLVEEIRAIVEKVGETPTVLVIGSKGRCGKGAIDLLTAAGASVTAWDIEETAAGGPFQDILSHDIFLNCVFIQNAIPPFLTKEIVRIEPRRLSVICDVSCDPYGNYNPVPVYEQCTTFEKPIETIVDGENPLYLIAIDHLPSLLPRESSEDFCGQLLPYLLQLDNPEQDVWKRARDLFVSKTSLV